MRDFGIETYQVVGVMDGKNWSQVRIVIPLSISEYKENGGLVIVMSLEGDQETTLMGGDWIEEIVESFQGREKGEDKEWLKEILEKMEDKVGAKGGLVVGVILEKDDGRKLYVGGVGRGMNTVIKRGERKGRLWGSEVSGVISGALLRDDVIIIGTEDFWNQIWNKLKAKDLEEMVEEARLMTINHGGARMAGLVIRSNGFTSGVESNSGIRETDGVEEEMGVISMQKRDTPIDEPMVSDEVVPKKGSWVRIWQKGVRLDSGKSRKLGGVVLALVLLLLVASVAMGWWQKQRRAEDEVYKQATEPIIHSLDEARSLKDLNPSRARSLVMEAKEGIEKQGSVFEEGRFASKWKDLEVDVLKAWNEVSGEKVKEGKVWLDMEVVKDGMRVDQLVIVDGTLIVLDKNGEVAASVVLDDKSATVVAGGETLDGVKSVGGMGSEKIVFLTDSGVVEVDRESKESKVVIEKEDGWERIVDIDGFGSSLYLLDDIEVWKYPGTDTGLGGRRRYLGVGVEPSLSDAIDLEIDGEVWVLLSTGEVFRFERGNKKDFEIKGLTDGFGKASDLALGEKGVYILDKEKMRVVVVDKETGEYRMEVKWEGLKDSSGMVVDEEKNMLLVGKDGKVMEIGL